MRHVFFIIAYLFIHSNILHFAKEEDKKNDEKEKTEKEKTKDSIKKNKEDIEIEELQKTIDALTKKLEVLAKEDTLSMYTEENKSFSEINKKEIEKINKSLADLKTQIYVMDKKLKEAEYKQTLNTKNEKLKELSDEKKQKEDKENQKKLDIQKKTIEALKLEMNILEIKVAIHEKEMQLAIFEKRKINTNPNEIAKLEKLKFEVENSKTQVKQKKEQLKLKEIEFNKKKLELEQEKFELERKNFQQHKEIIDLTYENEVLKQKNDKLNYQIEILKNQELLKEEERKAKENLSSGVIQYLENPLGEDGVLILSDRQINVGLVINQEAADLVSHLIDFYNNDEKHRKYPIFLIFDECWGGRCDCMFDIINKMQQSKSPVYVVVKRAAYSAAAVITTCAEKSFICQGAEMLHHQPQCYGWFRANVRKWEETVRFWKTYAKKCHEFMMKKLNCTYEQFVDKMYKNSCDGEFWLLLDQAAVREKWVDKVITGVRDSSILNKKNDKKNTPSWNRSKQKEIVQQIIDDFNFGKYWYIHLNKQLDS